MICIYTSVSRPEAAISRTHAAQHPFDTQNSYLLALLDHLPKPAPDTTGATTATSNAGGATAALPKGLLRRLQLILDLALLDVTALHFFPSTLAAAALGLLLPPEWAPALTACTVCM